MTVNHFLPKELKIFAFRIFLILIKTILSGKVIISSIFMFLKFQTGGIYYIDLVYLPLNGIC